MDCSSPGCSVRGIFQARIMEWVFISYSRGYSQLRDRTCVLCISCTGRQILYHFHHLGMPSSVCSLLPHPSIAPASSPLVINSLLSVPVILLLFWLHSLVCCFVCVCLIFVNLINVCLGVFHLGFILFGTLWVSWTCVTISFPILGKFSAIISPSIFSWPFCLLLLGLL